MLCCYISSVAMKGVVLRDDVRQSGVPFTMNQDGPEGGLGMCEGLGQTREAGMCEGLWLEQGGGPMDFFREGALAAGKLKAEEPTRSKAVVRIKIEGEELPKTQRGKGQKTAWRSMVVVSIVAARVVRRVVRRVPGAAPC